MALPKVTLSRNANIALLVTGLSGIFLILIAFFGTAWALDIGYEGGWECRTTLNSVYIASQSTWYKASNVPFGDVPWGPKGVQFDPTPSDQYPNWNFVQEPDISIKVDDPIHTVEDENHELITNAAGTSVIQAPPEDYIREISRASGDTMYFYHHHAYATVITVKTQSDRKDQGYGYQSLLETAGEEGIPIDFTVRFMFKVDPWDIVGNTYMDNGTEYVVTDSFAGVMGASYELVQSGFTDRTMQTRLEEKGPSDVLSTITTGWTIIKPEVHTACNMYLPDGSMTDLNGVPSDPSTITGVPNTVLIDVSGTLQSGAAQPWFALATPYDVFIQFTVRIDVLTAAAFAPVTGTDPLPEPPDDTVVGPAPFFYPLAYAIGQFFGTWWFVFVIIILVVFVILILIVATRLKALLGFGKK